MTARSYFREEVWPEGLGGAYGVFARIHRIFRGSVDLEHGFGQNSVRQFPVVAGALAFSLVGPVKK